MNETNGEHPDLRIALPAVPENVAIVRHALGGLVDVVGGAEGVDADVKLAVTEACANVVVHAYGGDDGGAMEVTAAIDGRTLDIAVSDDGRGMAPRIEGAPGHGLGLPLIATLSRGLELSTRPDGGTAVRMSFSLDRSEGIEATGGG